MQQTSPLGDTKYQLLLFLLDGESTAEGLTKRLAMNLSVIRRHLDDMAAKGLIESSSRRGGRGRPSKYYRITVEGRAAISAKYDVVIALLTAAMTKDVGPEKAREFFETAGGLLAEATGERANPDSL